MKRIIVLLVIAVMVITLVKADEYLFDNINADWYYNGTGWFHISAMKINSSNITAKTIDTSSNIYIGNKLLGSDIWLHWSNLTGYPAACSSGNAITQLGDSVICTSFLQNDSHAKLDTLNVTGYIHGQPLDGYLGSGIIWAEKVNDAGNLNVSVVSGLDVKYPAFVMRLVNTSNEVKYCSISSGTVTVPDESHTVYYIDSDCNIQSAPMHNYIETSLSPGGVADFFNVITHSGAVEVVSGSGLMNKEDIKIRKNTFKLTSLDVVSGMGISVEAFPNISISSGEYSYINEIFTTSKQNISAGDKIEFIYRQGGVWQHSDQTGINLTWCDDGTDSAQCSNPTKYRRYFIGLIGRNDTTDTTQLHQIAASETETFSNLASCIDTTTNPISINLPDNYKYGFVLLYAYCGRANDNDWTGSFIDLRTASTQVATGVPDLSIFLTRDGTRTLTSNWNFGAYNISTSTNWINAHGFNGTLAYLKNISSPQQLWLKTTNPADSHINLYTASGSGKIYMWGDLQGKTGGSITGFNTMSIGSINGLAELSISQTKIDSLGIYPLSDLTEDLGIAGSNRFRYAYIDKIESSNYVNTSKLLAGSELTANNTYTAAFGYKSIAEGYGSFAAGYQTRAKGDYSFAAGYQTVVSGKDGSAFGYKSTAGSYAFAAGAGDATGLLSTATGMSEASGYYSFAAGSGSLASGFYSFATGGYTTASGSGSAAIGYYSEASGQYSLAIGRAVRAIGDNSVALGGCPGGFSCVSTTARGFSSFAAGGCKSQDCKSPEAYGDFSVALGHSTNASGTASLAIGSHVIASGANSTAIGQGFINSVDNSFAVGFGDTTLQVKDNLVNVTGDINVTGQIYNKGIKKIITMDWYTATMGSGQENYIYGRDADDSSSEFDYFMAYIPLDMKPGTDINVTWRWTPTQDQTGDTAVVWDLVYNWHGGSGVIGSYSTHYSIVDNLATNEPRRTVHETKETISGVNPGDFMSFLLKRNGGSASDTCVGDVFIFLNAYIEYISDRV